MDTNAIIPVPKRHCKVRYNLTSTHATLMQPAPFGDPHTKERCPSCGVWKHKQRECSVCTKFPTRVQAAGA